MKDNYKVKTNIIIQIILLAFTLNGYAVWTTNNVGYCSSNNYLAGLPSKTRVECEQDCLAQPGCKGYMWESMSNNSCCSGVSRCQMVSNLCTNGTLVYVKPPMVPPSAPPNYKIEDTGDCELGDMSGVTLPKLSVTACATECDSRANCKGFSWNYTSSNSNYQTCSLKTIINKPFKAPQDTYYQCYTRNPDPLASYDPPVNGGCSNMDNLSNIIDANTAGDCASACSNNTLCIGFNYNSGTKKCATYRADFGGCVLNEQCSGWQWYKLKSAPASAITVSSDYSPSNPPCGYKVTNTNESCYDPLWKLGSGYTHSIKSLKDCASACTNDKNCQGFSYNKYSLCRWTTVNSCGGTLVDMTCPELVTSSNLPSGDKTVRVKDNSIFYSKVNDFVRGYEASINGDCAYTQHATSPQSVSNVSACQALCESKGTCSGFSFSPNSELASDSCKLYVNNLDDNNLVSCASTLRKHNTYQYYHKIQFNCGNGISTVPEMCDLGQASYDNTTSNNKFGGTFGCHSNCAQSWYSSGVVPGWKCSTDTTTVNQWKTDKLDSNYDYLISRQDNSFYDTKDYREKFIEFVTMNKSFPVSCSRAQVFAAPRFGRATSWFNTLSWSLNDININYSTPGTSSISLGRSNKISNGEYLLKGGFICSQDRKFKFGYETDGNLCLNKAGPSNAKVFVWCAFNTAAELTAATATSGLVMQDDCNLVLYGNFLQNKGVQFASGTNDSSRKGCYATLQNDSKFVIYDENQSLIKQINTATSGSPTDTFTDCN